MKHTFMYRQGYRYYVYDGPGSISYYHTLKEAQEHADRTGGRIGEVD